MQKLDNGAGIEIVHWKDLRDNLSFLDPELYSALEDFFCSKNKYLYRVRYPYGALIIDNGKLKLPDLPKESSSTQQEKLKEKILTDLSYSPIPLGLLLNKASEVFITTSCKTTIPLKDLQPGQFFGLFEMMNSISGITNNPIWSVSAGMRSLFLLPKISNILKHSKLAKAVNYTIPKNPPHALSEQWETFKKISKTNAPNQWFSDVIFFPLKQCEDKETKKLGDKLYQYISKTAWYQSQRTYDETVVNLIWLEIMEKLGSKNFRPRPYIVDSLKHLFSISTGSMPGFRICNEETVGPIKLISQLYEFSYGLNKNLLIYICPHNKIFNKSSPLYYSLSNPVILQGYPDHMQPNPMVDDLREISQLVDIIKNTVKGNDFILPANQYIVDSNFDFFHTHADKRYNINCTKEIPETDPLILTEKKLNPQKIFSYRCKFIRSCVRIT